MKKRNVYLFTLLLCSSFFLMQCSKDDQEDSRGGILTLKITDAASDDESSKGIFLTISRVLVNGKPVRTFATQTIEISSLKNGRTELLVDKELPAKVYDQLTIALSPYSDRTESSAGCYILTNNNTIYNLLPGNNGEYEISVYKDFELLPGTETRLVKQADCMVRLQV